MTPDYAIPAALTAALFLALADITVKRALQFTSPLMASLMTVAVQWVAYTIIILAAGTFSKMTSSGLIWFTVTGVLNPVLFLIFYLLGVQRIGVVRSSPIKGSSPLFAAICAYAVLGERLEALQYLGIASVVGGVIVISTEGLGKTARALKSSPSHRDVPTGVPPLQPAVYRKTDFLFPLMAGVTSGVSSVLFKISLSKMASPLLGAWIGSTLAVLIFPALAFLFPAGDRFRIHRRAWPWLIMTGLGAAVAVYALILAIDLGQVSIVTTLYQTSPLLLLIFSILFLRGLERVTPRVVLGGLMTVAGGILVSVF